MSGGHAILRTTLFSRWNIYLLSVDQDVLGGGLALAGKVNKEREKTVSRIDSNQTLHHSLGINLLLILHKIGHFRYIKIQLGEA